MLPADQNVSAASVVVDNLGNALLVITVARGVNGDTQVSGQGLDGVERASPRAI